MTLALLLQVTVVRSVIIPHRSRSFRSTTVTVSPLLLARTIAFLALLGIFDPHGGDGNSLFLFFSAPAANTWSWDAASLPLRGMSQHTLWHPTKWLHYPGKMAASGSFFLFYSAPTPHVAGFVAQLRWIQVGRSVGDRNWPISARTALNASKNTERT